MDMRHSSARVQHEIVRRTLSVAAVQEISPSMRRVIFQSESLKTFRSDGFDDHIKVFFPPDTGVDAPAIRRDFTPRKIDTANGLLTIDFALHDNGPATAWARRAKSGDTLDIAGPRGSYVVADDFNWYLMIGDATALPAIGRRLEELRARVPVTTIIAVPSELDRLLMETAATWTPIWLQHDQAADSDELAIRKTLEALTFPPGDGHIWLAGESMMVRSIRDYLVNDRRHPAEWLRAAGYWKRGQAGAHEHF